MAKRRYRSPILMDLNPEDPDIPFGGSQDTGGDVSIYTFEDDTLALEVAGLGYLDFQDMDLDGDYRITWKEYNDWLDTLIED